MVNDSILHEECGVFGAISMDGKSTPEIPSMAYYGLYALQHRGQESCGVAVCEDGVIRYRKDIGTVEDVFTKPIDEILGCATIAIGHVRYGSDKGEKDMLCAQPLVVNHIKGRLAICHNGSLVNYNELRNELELEGSIFQTTSDTEVISYVITKERLKTNSIEDALCSAMYRLKGAYSLVIMSPQKLIAARDKYGFRPLCYGITPDGSYVVASESCALDAAGASLIREIEPGEILVFSKNGVERITEHCDKAPRSLCIFEYIYFARPDSVIDGCSVHNARLRAGAFLAKDSPVDADVVIGVPDSGIDAAIGYARESGIPYGLGFIKNKYIGRTFISPSQRMREKKVKIKLNPVSETVNGKRVVLIDDSIVRGTTGKQIVSLLRQAGATEVHMRITAPPFINPCYYGTDIPDTSSLLAVGRTNEEIAEIMGVDSVDFISISRLSEIASQSSPNPMTSKNCGFCMACFDGNYPCKNEDTEERDRFNKKIEKK